MPYYDRAMSYHDGCAPSVADRPEAAEAAHAPAFSGWKSHVRGETSKQRLAFVAVCCVERLKSRMYAPSVVCTTNPVELTMMRARPRSAEKTASPHSRLC